MQIMDLGKKLVRCSQIFNSALNDGGATWYPF